jgi:hypothetical protein
LIRVRLAADFGMLSPVVDVMQIEASFGDHG